MAKVSTMCTSVLVGKKASLDGSTMIARNEDRYLAVHPKRFYMHPAVQGRKGVTLKSELNGFTAPLPEKGYRYQATPDADPQAEKEGVNDESGINEKNVAMSATESTYGNERTLAFDPLVDGGLGEDSLETLVLPYIDSARDGVLYLGKLIKQYGSNAGNSVLFSDKNDVWYMEIVTGHLWLAQRIPDDAYAVTANQVAIQQVDFKDTGNFLWADGIQNFVTEHHLNPDSLGWNFRHIFGTNTKKDHHYNTPRVWFAQRYLNPEIEQDPESVDLPFICYPSHRISLEDVEYILSSHYNETQFDPLGQGSHADKVRYRAISLSRTQNSHVLQIRNHVPESCAAVYWLSFGVPAFSPYVPFYANANDTDPSYSTTPMTLTYGSTSAYWLYRTLSMLVESHHSAFIQADLDYLKDARQQQHTLMAGTDAQVDKQPASQVTEFLTQQNYALVADMTKRTQVLISTLITQGVGLSRLTFDMDKNL
ncbi:C69 family dipeptidase [Loigolactobacillus backii]|uniref:Dipeptidase n=1 Tax=Loigolactobacillus backii TaxID=375175 RepID=A0A192GZW6_9LACO|nr:C69 family dipeptidase [Loigolactobacillus backii]ANK60854.1 peptidase C69 [Loigolactobacillus backii]ANK61573.1 peptidase C69 [Loigolactobacillus backii]ANK65807.1 peptidase C69 [Loigolactobacillus backii]ANK68283.1 peptidase C69 [Loigolactobacillus backii]ANK69229.1 peptidase C69 [Loigolactobacillus backii]